MNIPKLPSNATDREIATHVLHYYPELGPSLGRMLERFMELSMSEVPYDEMEKAVDNAETEIDELKSRLRSGVEEAAQDLIQEKIVDCKCPHCGSKIDISLFEFKPENSAS